MRFSTLCIIDQVPSRAIAVSMPDVSAETEEQGFEWVEEEATLTQESGSEGLNLQFVSETGRARPRGMTRHLIRSHVRRKRNTKPSPSGSNSAQHKPNKSNDDFGHYGLERSTNALVTIKSEHSSLASATGIRRLDPPDCLPIASDTRVRSLLSHFDQVVRHARGLPGPREGWLSFAVSDPAVLDVILFISALDIAGLRGQSISHDILYFKGETIRMINTRLREPDLVATDGTIAAVASLAQLENLTGTADSARIHASGLELMIKSRGGIKNLGSHGMPRRIVYWADSCKSVLLETPLRYKEVIIMDGPWTNDWGPYDRLAQLYISRLTNLTGSQKSSELTVEVYWELRKLSRLKEEAACSLKEGEALDMGYLNIPFTDTASSFEHRLILLQQVEPSSSPSQRLSVFMLFGYAAFLHIFIFVRDCSKDLPFSHLLSLRIRTILEKVDMKQLQRQYPEMMLWILLIGGLSGNLLSEQVWFAKLVSDYCLELGLCGGDGIASFLEKFMWSELYRSPVTQRFWEQISKAQGSETGYEVRRLPDTIAFISFNASPDFGP